MKRILHNLICRFGGHKIIWHGENGSCYESDFCRGKQHSKVK